MAGGGPCAAAKTGVLAAPTLGALGVKRNAVLTRPTVSCLEVQGCVAYRPSLTSPAGAQAARGFGCTSAPTYTLSNRGRLRTLVRHLLPGL
jgi:hypothetical protein